MLSDELINQIAAGEIVERPAFALKEIVENSIDAEASTIDVFIKNGGKTKIVVQDNGFGMSKEDLEMSVQRHATSKLTGRNLLDIQSYGFRGEAIPSIAAVSDFKIESNGFGINVNFSEKSEVYPSNISSGTRVIVERLFDKTPARLKFLKSDNVELTACVSTIENFSLTKTCVNFAIRSDEKDLYVTRSNSVDVRASNIFGKDVFERSVDIHAEEETLKVQGFLFHPSDSRYSQSSQRIFINNRIVSDKIVSASIRNAYRDLIPSGRFAMALLFIEIDPFYVDVNVSPTKSDVRFRDTHGVQKFLTESIKENLRKFDRVAVSIDIDKILDFPRIQESPKIQTTDEIVKVAPIIKEYGAERHMPFPRPVPQMKPLTQEIIQDLPREEDSFFGEPIAQVFDSYIITKTRDGIMIIDQHAVHEKITQEQMIKKLNKENKQYLLKPVIIDIPEAFNKNLLENLNNLGFFIEQVQNSLIISAIPTILTHDESVDFIKHILENPAEECSTIDVIRNKIANIACHNSIRFGRKLSIQEMKAIIKDMEETQSIHQCNHHRPSFVMLSKEKLQKLFDR